MSEQQLQQFFAEQLREVQQHSLDVADFTKNHQLPLARIKKIMKSDEDVRMISAEAPVLFAKACEIFILELTLKAWRHAEENKRRTLQRNDVSAAIARTDIFDFLLDVVPKEDLRQEGPEGGGNIPMQQGVPPPMAGMPGMPPGGPGGMLPPAMFPFPFNMPPGSEALLQGMQMPPMPPGSMQAMQGMPQQPQQAGQGEGMQGWQMPMMPQGMPQGNMQMPPGGGIPQGNMPMDPAALMSFMAGLGQGQQFPFFPPPASDPPPN